MMVTDTSTAGWARPASRILVSRPALPPVTVAASTDSSIAFSVRTDDGDTVTIATHRSQDRSLTYGPDGESSFIGASTRDVEMRLEGELDRRELRDLRHLMQRIERVVQSFFAGHEAAMSHQSAQLTRHLGSLDAFQLEIERSMAVSMTRGVGASDPPTIEDPIAAPEIA